MGDFSLLQTEKKTKDEEGGKGRKGASDEAATARVQGAAARLIFKKATHREGLLLQRMKGLEAEAAAATQADKRRQYIFCEGSNFQRGGPKGSSGDYFWRVGFKGVKVALE